MDQLGVAKRIQIPLVDQLGVPSQSHKAVIVEPNQEVEPEQVLELELEQELAQEQELDPHNNIQDQDPHPLQLVMVHMVPTQVTLIVPGALTQHTVATHMVIGVHMARMVHVIAVEHGHLFLVLAKHLQFLVARTLM